MNTLDELLRALDWATRMAEALRTEIIAKNASGILAERLELAKAILAITDLEEKLDKELTQ